MATVFVLTIDSPTATFGGGKRNGERQQIRKILGIVAEQIGGGSLVTGVIKDVNLKPNVDAVTVGSWTYTPQAAT
jgi:hypothetical protein